jgi:serine/threonine protein kinase
MSDDKNRDTLLSLLEAQPALQGRFCNLKRLNGDGGHGNFSLIFTADDRSTRGTVIVKFFHPLAFRETYRLDSFHRESQLLQQLNGTDVIVRQVAPCAEIQVPIKTPVGDFTLDVPYYVLERAERDIESVIAGGTTPTESTLLIFKAMCRAVQHIHSRSIVHRDLRPGNFLIFSDGSIRLSDFGTARRLTPDEKPMLDDYSGYPPGAIAYTAPELIASLHDVSSEIAYKADVFSLGAILFELFTGVMLGPQLFDDQNLLDIARYMGAVPREQRRFVFDGFVTELSDKRPLPDLAAFGISEHRAVLPIMDDLYKRIAALDYRKRNGNFPYMFLKLDQALLVIRNEAKYQRWRRLREKYRNDLREKRERIAQRIASGETR